MPTQIFTRSANENLYKLSCDFLPPHVERFRCVNFNHWQDANNYLHYILNNGADWVVNIDEDAFVTNWRAIVDMIEYMKAYGYEYAGMPDGGVCHHRIHSWIACNPFFNIFNARALREKMAVAGRQVIDSFQFDPSMEVNKPHFVTGEYQHDFYEPYYSLFYWLMQNSKGLYLKEHTHPDTISSGLLWNEKPFLYHSWYSREFDTNPVHRQRIVNLYKEAKIKVISNH